MIIEAKIVNVGKYSMDYEFPIPTICGEGFFIRHKKLEFTNKRYARMSVSTVSFGIQSCNYKDITKEIKSIFPVQLRKFVRVQTKEEYESNQKGIKEAYQSS